jgi:hypothetical protein
MLKLRFSQTDNPNTIKSSQSCSGNTHKVPGSSFAVLKPLDEMSKKAALWKDFRQDKSNSGHIARRSDDLKCSIVHGRYDGDERRLFSRSETWIKRNKKLELSTRFPGMEKTNSMEPSIPT